jgi:hypothetical protein
MRILYLNGSRGSGGIIPYRIASNSWENIFIFYLGEEELNPLTVSSTLNGISCSLSFHRDYNIKFVALLKEVFV